VTPRTFLNGRLLTAVVMLAIFVAMSIMALGFPAKARLMPLLFGIPGSVLALARVIVELRASEHMSDVEKKGNERAQQGEQQMFVWLILFFIGILLFGFIYAAPVLVFAFLCVGKKELLVTGLISAICTWVMLYGLFEIAFAIPLFQGLIVEWLLA